MSLPRLIKEGHIYLDVGGILYDVKCDIISFGNNFVPVQQTTGSFPKYVRKGQGTVTLDIREITQVYNFLNDDSIILQPFTFMQLLGNRK